MKTTLERTESTIARAKSESRTTSSVIEHLHTLYEHRELLYTWTLREISVRYKQSVLGGAWAVLQPVALMLIYSVVFSLLVRVPSDGIPYPVFAYTGLLGWTFFSNSITFAVPSLTNNLALVTKVYFPREILPIASVGAAFLDFLIALLPFLAMLIWYRMPVEPTILWVPVLIIIQFSLVFGIVFPCSALLVFYRDIRFMIPLALQIWLYATPIIYPITLVPEKYRLFYSMNPMVGIVDSYRRVILQGLPPNPEYLGLSTVISIFLALVGYHYFKHAEETFADHI